MASGLSLFDYNELSALTIIISSTIHIKQKHFNLQSIPNPSFYEILMSSKTSETFHRSVLPKSISLRLLKPTILLHTLPEHLYFKIKNYNDVSGTNSGNNKDLWEYGDA